VYHPSGGTALPLSIIFAAKVLVFIKDCLALGLRRSFIDPLLAGFVPSSAGCVYRVVGRIYYSRVSLRKIGRFLLTRPTVGHRLSSGRPETITVATRCYTCFVQHLSVHTTMTGHSPHTNLEFSATVDTQVHRPLGSTRHFPVGGILGPGFLY
jgi:hypothetical protein